MDDKLFTWLNNELSRNNVYHNHKETMAWLATIAFITGVIAGLGVNISEIAKPYVTGIFTLIFMGVILFVIWQFRNRDIARLKVQHLTITCLNLLKNSFPSEWEKCIDEYWMLPKYVVNNMGNESKKINQFGGGTGIPQAISYVAITVAAALFYVAVWVGF